MNYSYQRLEFEAKQEELLKKLLLGFISTKHSMKKITAKAFLLLSFMGLASLASAQTLPNPYDLSSGDYTFNFMDTISAGTYPPNMMFHTMGSAQPSDTAKPTGDFTCRYSLTVRSRFNAEFVNGIAFQNAGQGLNVNCPNSPSSISQRFVGEIVLALNTSNRQNIMVNWTGRMLSSLVYADTLPVTGQSNRFFNVKLQYSLDTALGYTDVPGNNAFWCNLNDTTYRLNGDSAVYSNMLPSDCENQGVVYLRWIYNSDGVGQGARPKLAVDDILVTSSLLTGMPVTKSNASWQAYPNPNNGELLQFSQTLPMVQIFSASGSKVAQASNTRSMSLQGLSPGLYLLVDQNGASRRLVIR